MNVIMSELWGSSFLVQHLTRQLTFSTTLLAAYNLAAPASALPPFTALTTPLLSTLYHNPFSCKSFLFHAICDHESNRLAMTSPAPDHFLLTVRNPFAPWSIKRPSFGLFSRGQNLYTGHVKFSADILSQIHVKAFLQPFIGIDGKLCYTQNLPYWQNMKHDIYVCIYTRIHQGSLGRQAQASWTKAGSGGLSVALLVHNWWERGGQKQALQQ